MNVRVAMAAVLLLGCGTAVTAVEAQEQVPEKGVIRVPGAELPYAIEGAGRPCLVYGSPVYYPRSFSARLKAALRCVHVAERGFVPGASRSGDAPFGVLEAAADIEATRRALGMEDFVLVGHSVHGIVVLAYAALHPEHVSHVVAIGAPPALPIPRDSVSAYRARFFGATRQARHEANRRALDSLVSAHPGRAVVANYIANGALYWADPSFDSTPLWEGVEINAQLVQDLQGSPFSWEDPSREVAVPAFVALGRHDYVVPPNVWLGASTPFSSLTVSVFERAGHTPQLEDSEAFDEQVLSWLAAHR